MAPVTKLSIIPLLALSLSKCYLDSISLISVKFTRQEFSKVLLNY